MTTDHAQTVRDSIDAALNLIAKYNRDPQGVSYEHEHCVVMEGLRNAARELAALVAERDAAQARLIQFADVPSAFRRVEAAEAALVEAERRELAWAERAEVAESELRDDGTPVAAYLHFKQRAEKAEAERDALAAALRDIAEPRQQEEGDWGATYDWRESSTYRRDVARAALARLEGTK